MSMKKFALFGAVALVMAGCSSVNLDNATVEDRNAAASETAVAKAAVAPVENANADQRAIANVTRVVYFDYDSSVIKSEFQSVIEAHARFIKADAKRKVAIEGHTDERGGREYNLALGQRRSEAVRSALKVLGVADNQVEAVSFGKEKPAVQGNTEAVWAKNRRAEISYR
jgi:peptidoglycan-associated lipoprotein